MNGFWSIRSSKASQFLHRPQDQRRIGLMELNGRDRNNEAWRNGGEGHWMAEENQTIIESVLVKKKKNRLFRSMCSLSTSHLYGLPNQWRGVFHTHRQGLGLCSKIGHIYVLICDASLGWKKVSGHFVGGSIVHQNITELPLYNNDEPSKTSIQDKITTTACAPWFLTDDFNWKPLKNCRSIMKWNTVRYCMLYDGG